MEIQNLYATIGAVTAVIAGNSALFLWFRYSMNESDRTAEEDNENLCSLKEPKKVKDFYK